MMNWIADRVKTVLASLPAHVLLVAACKTRTPGEVHEAIDGGVTAIGHNYVQEAESMQQVMSEWKTQPERRVRWHFIGHLQQNKAKKAVTLFDIIETIDSARIAHTVDHHCAAFGKIMPVLIEINSGRESSKTGVRPDRVEDLAREICGLQNIRLQGLMTMGPRFGNPEDARPYFRLTKELFDKLASMNLPNVEMRYLSMGMSNSYRVAIEEGANIVRIGTHLFGEQQDV